jgi:hypothetical protein
LRADVDTKSTTSRFGYDDAMTRQGKDDSEDSKRLHKNGTIHGGNDATHSSSSSREGHVQRHKMDERRNDGHEHGETHGMAQDAVEMAHNAVDAVTDAVKTAVSTIEHAVMDSEKASGEETPSSKKKSHHATTTTTTHHGAEERAREQHGTTVPKRKNEMRRRDSKSKDGKKATDGLVQAVESLRESASAGVKVCGNVYVQSFEDKLPVPVRKVVKGVRGEVRGAADVLFPALWSGVVLTTHVAAEGGSAMKRKGEEGLKFVGDAAKSALDKAKPTKTSSSSGNLPKGGNHKRSASTATKNGSSFSDGFNEVKGKAQEAVSDSVRRFNESREATVRRIEKFVNEKKNGVKDGGSKAVAHKPKKAANSAPTRKTTAQRAKKIDSTNLRDPLNGAIPPEMTREVKDRLRAFEENIGNLPIVQSVKPKVAEFVHSWAERQRGVVGNLHASTEGGVETLRNFRADLVRRARGAKPHVETGVHRAQSFFSSGVDKATRMVLPLARHDWQEAHRERAQSAETATDNAQILEHEIKQSKARERDDGLEEPLLSKPIKVIVKERDNLFDIASIAGISVMDLARYNNLRPDPHTSFLKLHPGQVLYVPSQSLLDRLPAIDRTKEPAYELSVKVIDAPARKSPSSKSRLVDPLRHSRHRATTKLQLHESAEKSHPFVRNLAGSLGLVACAFMLRSVRDAMDDEED